MIGVALRRGVSVRHQLLNKNTALVFTENPVRFLSDRNEKDIYCPHKKPKVCHKPIDQTRLGADCKEVQDAITDKNYPTMDCNSPMGPPPPNYDPYRIKVPDYIVPPLPPSGAKEFQEAGFSPIKIPMDLLRIGPIVHRDYWKGRIKPTVSGPQKTMSKLGYHGRMKLKFAFHEPWRPLDRLSLLDQADKQEKGELVPSTDKQVTIP